MSPFHLLSSAQAHLWITYGWLGMCVLAVVVFVLIIWATSIHYSSRAKWRTLDVLLAATLIQELPNAVVVCTMAAIKGAFIHLPRHMTSTHAYFLVWGTSAVRFYQFAIITSLIVDRALILRWPYQYRFTVRHSQIRIYLLALSLVATAIGGYAMLGHQQYIDSLNPFNETNTATTFYGFTFDPNTYSAHFNYFFLSVNVLFAVICIVSFVYVECTRPRNSSSRATVTGKNHRYLPSITTLFTNATTSSTATSSSTSSSLSASSPLPSRFSSLANLTNATPATGITASGEAVSGKSAPLPPYYFPKQRESSQQPPPTARNGTDTLNSLYPISIVDLMSQENGQSTIHPSSTYTSMTTTDNSIYRLLDNTGHHSRTNSLNQITVEQSKEQQGYQHRGNFPTSEPTSSLDPLNPRGNYTKPRHHHSHHYSSQIKLNTSNDFDYSRSAFDLRWSSAIGPVTFCFAFNHGPYLVSRHFCLLIMRKQERERKKCAHCH